MISYPGIVKNYASYFDTPQRKNYLGLGVTLVTLIVLVLMIYPAVFYLLDLNSQLTANRKIDKLLSEKITNLDSAKQYLGSLQESLTTIDTSLPNSASIAEYLKNLETELQGSLAVISNITMDETQLISSSKGRPPQLIPVNYNLALSGSFENLKQALNQLETLSRFTDITSATFTAKKETGGELKLVLAARTYFYGSPEVADKKTVGVTE